MMRLVNNKALAVKLARQLRKDATKAESILWQILRNRKLEGFKFNRQFPIHFELNGEYKFFIVDFYCHEKKLVIEVDGGYHEFQKEYDEIRTEIIESKRLKVIRFRNEEVENEIKKVIDKIKSELKTDK